MTMSKTEAIHTCTLIGWVCGFDRPSGGPYTAEQAKTAATYLAGRAHATLHAGPTEDRIAAAFDRIAADATEQSVGNGLYLGSELIQGRPHHWAGVRVQPVTVGCRPDGAVSGWSDGAGWEPALDPDALYVIVDEADDGPDAPIGGE